MFELILFIIIISVVAKKSKKKNAETKPNVPRKRNSDETAYAFTSQTQQRPAQARTVQTKPQQRPAQTRPVQSKPQQKQTPPKSVQKEPMSTTEMLEAKALADDREERIEKQKQRMENQKHYGHLNYAQKYIIGDMVPKGQRMVFCPYCNAENLIPAYSSAKDYNCYFCREEL